jgi:hypothetical protein
MLKPTLLGLGRFLISSHQIDLLGSPNCYSERLDLRQPAQVLQSVSFNLQVLQRALQRDNLYLEKLAYPRVHGQLGTKVDCRLSRFFSERTVMP